jgi:hypothetical protein
MEHAGIQQQLLTMLQEIAALVRVLTNNQEALKAEHDRAGRALGEWFGRLGIVVMARSPL